MNKKITFAESAKRQKPTGTIRQKPEERGREEVYKQKKLPGFEVPKKSMRKNNKAMKNKKMVGEDREKEP